MGKGDVLVGDGKAGGGVRHEGAGGGPMGRVCTAGTLGPIGPGSTGGVLVLAAVDHRSQVHGQQSA